MNIPELALKHIHAHTQHTLNSMFYNSLVEKDPIYKFSISYIIYRNIIHRKISRLYKSLLSHTIVFLVLKGWSKKQG